MVQILPFLRGDLPVFPLFDPVQSQIHDPDSLQFLYFISQILTHPADLPVQSLRQNNAEAALSCLLYPARSGYCIQDWNSSAHPADKISVQRFIYNNKVLFLMIIACAHNLVDQVTLICQKKQALGFLVQSAYRINTQRIIQIIRDCCFLPLLLCAAYDSSGLIKE